MKRTCTVLFGAVFALGLASCGDPFEAGLAKAHANDTSAEGQAYAEPMRQLVANALQSAMRSCIQSPANVPTTDFAIVFSVDGDGTPAQTAVRSPAVERLSDASPNGAEKGARFDLRPAVG